MLSSCCHSWEKFEESLEKVDQSCAVSVELEDTYAVDTDDTYTVDSVSQFSIEQQIALYERKPPSTISSEEKTINQIDEATGRLSTRSTKSLILFPSYKKMEPTKLSPDIKISTTAQLIQRSMSVLKICCTIPSDNSSVHMHQKLEGNQKLCDICRHKVVGLPPTLQSAHLASEDEALDATSADRRHSSTPKSLSSGDPIIQKSAMSNLSVNPPGASAAPTRTDEQTLELIVPDRVSRLSCCEDETDIDASTPTSEDGESVEKDETTSITDHTQQENTSMADQNWQETASMTDQTEVISNNNKMCDNVKESDVNQADHELTCEQEILLQSSSGVPDSSLGKKSVNQSSYTPHDLKLDTVRKKSSKKLSKIRSVKKSPYLAGPVVVNSVGAPRGPTSAVSSKSYMAKRWTHVELDVLDKRSKSSLSYSKDNASLIENKEGYKRGSTAISPRTSSQHKLSARYSYLVIC